LSEQQIADQQEIIAMSNLELGDLRTKIEQIAVIRLTVLTQVKEAIEAELAFTNVDNQDVQIASNGNIILNNKLMFASNSYTITLEGKDLLDELAVVFETILDDEDIRANIDAINIEGHTDNVNTAEYNRQLSSERAISVVDYLLQTNTDLESKYGSYFVASGYSEYRPLVLGNSELARSSNRRIEISIILKDSNIQSIIDSYLQQSNSLFEQN
nr:OmpA family protein [Vallitaleaceae bacterium]